MAAEGNFPKIDGDVYYASEMNKNLHNFWGDGSDGALNVASGTTTIATNIKQYSSISVSNGATLTFSGHGKYYVFCTGNVTIDGTLAIPVRATTLPTALDATAGGAAISYDVPGTAGVGSGTIRVYEWIVPSTPSTSNSGGVGCAGTGGSGKAGSGGGGGGGAGSGGAGGVGGSGSGGGTGVAGTAGDGKATVIFIVKGSFSMASTGSISGAGAAGGAGGDAQVPGGGGGGGGGGQVIGIILGDLILTSGASISLGGGNGGKGGDSSYTYPNGGGGGGGGGGLLSLACCGALSNSATITVTAGSGGAVGTGGSGGAAGSNGVAGISWVIKV